MNTTGPSISFLSGSTIGRQDVQPEPDGSSVPLGSFKPATEIVFLIGGWMIHRQSSSSRVMINVVRQGSPELRQLHNGRSTSLVAQETSSDRSLPT